MEAPTDSTTSSIVNKKGNLFMTITTMYRLQYVPLVIIGDLDSLREEVQAFYEKHGSKII